MTSVVIDANIAIYAVLPMPRHEAAISLIERLVQSETLLFAPHLWLSEVATGIRKTAAIIGLDDETGVLDVALGLPIEVVSEDASLCRDAYRLAKKLQQRAVYDAIYLALAQRLQAQFWTADRKFYNRCRENGLKFVTLLKE